MSAKRHCFLIFARDAEPYFQEGKTAREALARAFLPGGFRSALGIIRFDLVPPRMRSAGAFTAYIGQPALGPAKLAKPAMKGTA